MSNIAIESFIERWRKFAWGCVPLTSAQVDVIENSLGVRLPYPYRAFLEAYGAPSFGTAVLDAVCEQLLDLPDLQEFFKPADVVENTIQWRESGLGPEFVAFALLGTGDFFCFRFKNDNSSAVADANVWYFSHEDHDSYDFGLTFEELLQMYGEIPKSVA